MGLKDFLHSSVLYLDTAIFIYTVEVSDQYWTLLESFWLQVYERSLSIQTSEMTLLEVLVQPIKHQNNELISDYEAFLADPSIRVQPITREILRGAAELRAIYKVQTPDAIHLATAIACGCDIFLTNDIALQKIPDLGLEILALKDLI